jgi:dTDP-4-amino-4,6-dideoxygalactose transaminase
MQVPFLDLKAQHDPIRGEILAAMAEVIEANAFAGGPFVKKFEDEFAVYCRTKHAVGVGNGTDALWLALIGLGVGAGDEVITVPNTFIATAEAISLVGAKPVFVDVDPKTYTLDPSLLEAAINSKTKAIIPVHLYGQMADMDPIMAIAKKHGLFVIEDACQAHGAEYKGQRAGSIGHAGCFSFYPGKNLGAWGEAGAVTTNDQALARKMMVFRDHGQETKYNHAMIGWNARMDGIQAAVLRVKLKNLDACNSARRRHAERYLMRLSGLESLVVEHAADYGSHVYHLFVVRVADRDRVLRHLANEGISCGIHYPNPVHLLKAYEGLRLGVGSFPVTERLASEILSLPMYPELADAQIEMVAQKLKSELDEAKVLEVQGARA